MQNKPIDWKYLLIEAGLLLLFSYLFLFAGFADVFYNMNVLWVLAILVTVGSILILLVKKPKTIQLNLPMLIFFGACIISTILSVDPRRSVDQLYFFVLTAFVFIASVSLVRSGIQEGLITKCILIAGFMTSIVLFLNAAVWYALWLKAMPGVIIPTISYRLPSSNVLIMFLNPLLFLVISTIFGTRTKIWKILLVLYALFVAFLIFLTSSRSGWLGTASGLLILLLLSGRVGWIRWKKLPEWMKRHKLATVIAIIGMFVIAGSILFVMVQQSAHPTHRVVSEARSEFWPPAWDAFLQHPLTGQGLFTFNTKLLQTQSVPPFKIFVHAHSIPINTLAEMGLIGEAALICLVISVAIAFWRKFRQSNSTNATLLMAAIAAFVGACVHGLFDCYNQPFGFWLVVILAGCTLATPVPGKSRWYDRQWWLLLFVPIVWLNLWLLHDYNAGVAAGDAGQVNEAIEELENVVRRDPYSAVGHQQLSLAFSMDPLQRDEAIRELERTIQLDPDWALNYANLGALYAQTGDLQKAVDLMLVAISKSPDCALFHLNLGVLYERLDDQTNARMEFRKYLDTMPEFTDSQFWYQTELRENVVQEWQDQNPVLERTIDEVLRSIREDPDELSNYIEAARIEITSGDIDQAEKHLILARMVYTTRPWELMDVYWMQARIAADRNDLDTAIALGETALLYYHDHDVGGPGNTHGIRYVNLVFRKPSMRTVLVPDMILNPFPKSFAGYMEDLADWYDALEDPAAAERIRTELAGYLSEFMEQEQP